MGLGKTEVSLFEQEEIEKKRAKHVWPSAASFLDLWV